MPQPAPFALGLPGRVRFAVRRCLCFSLACSLGLSVGCAVALDVCCSFAVSVTSPLVVRLALTHTGSLGFGLARGLIIPFGIRAGVA